MLPQFDNYETLSTLGSGSFGHAYLARDVETNAKVVLKTASAEDLATEGSVLSLLHHDNIVKLHSLRSDFLVLEYLRGPTLDASLPLDETAARSVLRQLASALAHVHERGFVHRDVKPANVFLEADGRAVLSDFGVAAKTGVLAERAGQVLTGTPLFASPEQLVAGTPLNGASDVYGLGVTIYYSLSEGLPYLINDFATLEDAILNREPVPLDKLVDVSPELVSWLLQMLAKKPEARPSAREVQLAFTQR